MIRARGMSTVSAIAKDLHHQTLPEGSTVFVLLTHERGWKRCVIPYRKMLHFHARFPHPEKARHFPMARIDY
jgi:hypothetical protein